MNIYIYIHFENVTIIKIYTIAKFLHAMNIDSMTCHNKASNIDAIDNIFKGIVPKK